MPSSLTSVGAAVIAAEDLPARAEQLRDPGHGLVAARGIHRQLDAGGDLVTCKGPGLGDALKGAAVRVGGGRYRPRKIGQQGLHPSRLQVRKPPADLVE